MGLSDDIATIEVALAGNPNTGKSTLFGELTRTRQRVGNYPGVTVEKKAGLMALGDRPVTLIDLPGTYSLAAASRDERVVIDVLAGHIEGTKRPDLVVCVVDASNLMRNLFLASQIADMGLPIIIALNKADTAADHGITVDLELLGRRLGVPVVRTVASRGQGVDELRRAIDRALASQPQMRPVDWPESITRAVGLVRQQVQNSTGRWVSSAEIHRLLFDDQSAVADRIGWDAATCAEQLAEPRRIVEEAGYQRTSVESVLRYSHLGELLEAVVEYPTRRRVTRSESVDRVLTHRVAGLVVFAAMMFVVFYSIYALAVPLMGAVEWVFTAIGDGVGPMLADYPMLQSLAVDAVIGGVGGVIVFLPQILILFFFISLLEDSGYMARAAMLVDRLFRWCGLNGRSFVPMLSSFACAVPGVMAARTIENPRARLTTILISPLMSCSARLPVYVLMISAFVAPLYGETVAAATLFAMHFVGLVVALPVAFIINRFLFRVSPQPFMMEMPAYRVPRLRDVFGRMWENGREFLVRAGTIILVMSIIIWAMLYFPRPAEVADEATARFTEQLADERDVTLEQARQWIADEQTQLAETLEHRIEGAYVQQSIMGRLGRTIQPVFAPAGFDWKITIGVLSSFPAREVIIATLGIIYNLGGDVDESSDRLNNALAQARWDSGPREGEKVFNVPVAMAVMVFFALCSQCGATVATVAKESNWGWALFGFVYMSVLAWIGAVAVYQVGMAITG